MHVPDGVLSTPVCLMGHALSAGALVGAAYAWRRESEAAARELPLPLSPAPVPLVGCLAAAVFAGQMLNFAIPGLPVSGHLVGGALAAAVVGPAAGTWALFCVLLVQAVCFADGGLMALGVNTLNMAVVGCWALPVTQSVLGRITAAPPLALTAFLASLLGVVTAASLFCLEFALSGRTDSPLAAVAGSMLPLHAAIGAIEGLITAAAVLVIGVALQSRMLAGVPRPVLCERLAAGLAVAALATAVVASPWASSYPDGLTAVAERFGFDRLEQVTVLVFDGYSVGPMPLLGTSLAGAVGVMLLIATALVPRLVPLKARGK